MTRRVSRICVGNKVTSIKALHLLVILVVVLIVLCTQYLFQVINTSNRKSDVPKEDPSSHSRTTTAKRPLAETVVLNSCPFANLDPFDPSITQYVNKNNGAINCSEGLPSLVYLDGEMLRVNTTKVHQTVGHVDYCRYTPLELSDENDSNLRSLKWSEKFLKDPIRLSPTDEHLLIECYFKDILVGETYKSRILEKPEREKRREADFTHHKKENAPLETMNVLIVGMDGMSKLNLIRTMPKTRKFILNNLNGKELNKFNNVGPNTFPNMLAFLSGLSRKDLSKRWNKTLYFDGIENIFSWHNFQKAGYRTAMMFDAIHDSVFHYTQKGWKHPPWNYYTRPLSLQMDRSRKRNKQMAGYCVGDVPELVILQDYILQLTSKFKNAKKKPYFSYSFFTTLTHKDQNEASKGDDIYLAFLQQLNQSNILANTVFIFFSDHGLRFGPFRNTIQGRLETNSPFVFFMFPPWFEKKYPEVMNTFKINQNRLTTFFDLNKTLMDLLTFTGKTKKGSLESRGISLFDEIPIERTCHHADIPLENCNCKLLSNESVPQQLSQDISNQLLDYIVNRTRSHRNICALLTLKTVHSMITIKANEATDNAVYYQVTIETTPGETIYEALLQYDLTSRQASLASLIKRLTFYNGQDRCVQTNDLKPFCLCMS